LDKVTRIARERGLIESFYAQQEREYSQQQQNDNTADHIKRAEKIDNLLYGLVDDGEITEEEYHALSIAIQDLWNNNPRAHKGRGLGEGFGEFGNDELFDGYEPSDDEKAEYDEAQERKEQVRLARQREQKRKSRAKSSMGWQPEDEQPELYNERSENPNF
jgi:hypothetical protein